MYIPIVYQDKNLIIVNKPVGLATHSDKTDGDGFDVVNLLKKQLGLDYLGVHHRLDREVGGLLAFAAQPEANANLAKAFEGRQAIKEYRAIVHRKLPHPKGTITLPLIEASNGRWRTARSHETTAKPARTDYTVEKVGPDYSLVKLRLETGRTHQLRVHLAALGCPIVGDPLYGKNDPFPALLLQAWRLALPQEGAEAALQFEAPPLPILEQALHGQDLPELALATTLATSGITNLQKGDRIGLLGLLELAKLRRAPLANDPSQATTAYRLINGIGDGLPDVTLDCYGAVLVLNCYDDRVQQKHPALQILLDAIAEIWPAHSIYAKFRPKQLSNLSKNSETIAPNEPLIGSNKPTVFIKENNTSYIIRANDGFSTGLFLDMREVRATLHGWIKDKTVLNCFCYTGGFGLVANLNAAKRVVNLDASGKVLEWAKENYRANGLVPDDYDFIEGDVFDWLGRFGRREQLFDVVILDPPSYSTVKKRRWAVERNYDELVELAARTVAPQGLLLACTNHAGLSRANFRQMVERGLSRANRQADIIGFYHEPTLDFPNVEGTEAYLKVLNLRLK